MTIDALPQAPSTSDPTNFATEADAFIAALPTFRTQLNTTAAGINASAAGGGVTIPYTFSATITDADPGNGYLRLSSATQNASTTLRLDLLDAAAVDRTATLATFDDSTSTVKGQVRVQKVGDGSKWLLFDLTAMSAPGSPDPGYRNFTIANVDSSAASPFIEGDDILVMFTRTGDKGDTGATGATGAAGNALVLLSTVTANNSATVDVETTLDATYDAYLLIATGVTIANDSESLRCQLKIGGAYLATSTYFYHASVPNSSAATYSGVNAALAGMEASIRISGAIGSAAGEHINIEVKISNPAGTTLSKTIRWSGEAINNSGEIYPITGAGGNGGTAALTGLRFFASLGNILSGDFRLYGYKRV